MTRRLITLIAATAMLLALLPGAAFANSASTARLVQGTEVFPGATTYGIQVTNNERNLSILSGSTIRFVDIVLPRSSGITNSTATLEAPNGWTAQRFDAGSLQLLRFTGGTISPGSSTTFSFPATALAPLSGDQKGAFQVNVSSSADGNPARAANDGGLETLIRTLRLIDLAPVGPALALNPHRDMTAGQSITYRATFENLARSGQAISPTLQSSNSGDEVSAPASVTIPAQSTGAASYTVQLGAANSDRVSTFTASGTSERSKIDSLQDTYNVLAPARILPDYQNFFPRVISTRTPESRTFTLPAEKLGTPGVNITSGNLAINGTSVSVNNVGFTRNRQTGDLVFGPVTLPSTLDSGEYDVTFTLNGTDDNGAPFTFNETVSKLLRIDNLLPIITINPIQLPSGQQHGRHGNQVTVSGTIDPNGGTAVDLESLTLSSTAGDLIEITNVSRDGNNFSGQANLNFDGAKGTDTNTFRAAATAIDQAGNRVTGASPSIIFDDVAPAISSGRTVRSATYGDANKTVVEVTVDESHILRGGCSTDLWTVEGGGGVSQVLYTNGQPCSATDQDPGNNVRVLVPSNNLPITASPRVTYTDRNDLLIVRYDRLRDGALNRGITKTIDTVIGILPPAPDLLGAKRGGSQGLDEVAPFDDDAFWTRFSGNDLRLTVGGVRAGWFVRLRDAAGNPVGGMVQSDNDTSIDIIVPLSGSDGKRDFLLDFRNSAGFGETKAFSVVLDRVAPTIGNATLTNPAEGKIELTFSEKVWEYDANPVDFFAWSPNTDDDPSDPNDDRLYYPVEQVQASRSNTWTLTSSRFEGELGGVDYFMVRPEGRRVEDRAGNKLVNTLQH